MVPECAFVYPSGHRCGRIPRRGESLCPGHRHAGRAVPRDHEEYERELFAYADRLDTMSLDDILDSLQDCLLALQPLFDRKSMRRFLPHYDHANIAITTAIDRAGEAALAQVPAPRPSPATPSLERLSPKHFSPEQFEKMCQSLLTNAESYKSPNPQ